MKLFLIRHGQTTTNLQKIFTGQMDVPLTEQGQQEAMAIRPVLSAIPFDRVYSSDLQRTIHTQQLALPDFHAITTPLLREYDLGKMNGQPYTNKHPGTGPMGYAACGGESTEEVCARLRTFLSTLEADQCEYVAAFAHNGIMNCMLRLVLGKDANLTGVYSSNCAIHVFEFKENRWRLLAWNYMKPL